MTRLSRAAFVLGFAAVSLAARGASAQDTTYRGITLVGNYDPTRDKYGIVVLPVTGAFGDSIRTIVQRDLDYGDRFTVIPIDSADPSALRGATGAGLNYPLFAKLNAVAAVQIMPVAAGLHVAVHDVNKGQVINVGEFTVPANGLGRDWRMAIHRVSDEIERWVTGQRGIAATRIAYVRGTGSQAAMRIVDSDGADEITVPTEECGVSPGWNPLGNLLTYTTCGASSRLFVIDLATGRSRTLAGPMRNVGFSSPVFAADGNAVIFSRYGDNGTDLYSLNLLGNDPAKRLTVGRGVENSLPAPSPDGRRIVYTGNALGRPELYIMDVDGTNAEVLTNYEDSEKNYRSDPDWSPDGRMIAYQERMNGRFQIRTISPSGSAPKTRTSEGENEQPSWAPDGRHLVFTSTRTGVRQLWVMDLETGRVRQLTKSAGSRLAAWSPRLAMP
jgi:TolB protein